MGGSIAPKMAVFNKNYTVTPPSLTLYFDYFCNPKLLKM